MTTLSIDLGASNIRSAIVDSTKIRDKLSVPTPKTRKQILSALFQLIKTYKKPGKICVSIAGFESKGSIKGSRNMDFKKVPLKSILKKKYNLPVFIENDANCAALAELYYGKGKGKKNFVLLTLGTGIGGGIIINSKLYKGHRGAAGEIGRSLFENKPFEEIASGTASVSLARKSGLKITSLKLEELAHKGNKKAISVYNQIGKHLGIGLLNISYLLDPEIIILGGGFAKVNHIYKPLLSTFHKRDELKRKIPVTHAKLSDNAGLIGAALLPKN